MDKQETEARFRIVVPTYRHADLLAGLLDCLGPQLRVSPDFRLTIVNDGSDSPAYRRVIAEWEGLVDYIALPRNCKRIGARLAGYAEATEEYIVFTDDDCRPGPLWLDWIRATVDARPLADILAGTSTLTTARRGLLDRFWQDQPNATPRPAIIEGELVTAVNCNAVYRRALIADIPDPDPASHHFPDDHFLTQEALARGASYLALETLTVEHVARPSLWSFLLMQWGYGLGAAEYAVTRRDPRLAKLFGVPLGKALRLGWRGEGTQVRSRLVSALSRGAFALGWWQGVRRYGRPAGIDAREMRSWKAPFAEMVETVPPVSAVD